jgi:hypothetical protein
LAKAMAFAMGSGLQWFRTKRQLLLSARPGCPLKIADPPAILHPRKMIWGEALPAFRRMRQMMKKPLLLALCAAVALPVLSSFAAAGPIESACMRSGRKQANRALCGCIQQVADMTLQRRDQSRAAAFFRDPEKAHKVWMSKSKSDDDFWDRYKAFGAQAEAYCAPQGN